MGKISILMVSFLLGFAFQAKGATYTVTSILNGDNENPPVTTSFSGTVAGTFDSVTGNMEFTITHNIVEPTTITGSHIHGPADVNSNAGVIRGFSMNQALTTQQISLNIPQDDINSVINGLSYINIHTNDNPSGEIRGQLILTLVGSSAGQDPHFHGINGEQLDVVIDVESSNKRFSIYCDKNVVLNALFSPNEKNFLFMTEFTGNFKGIEFTLKMGKLPRFYGDYYIENEKENRTRFVLENVGTVESDGKKMIAKLDDLQININTATDAYQNVYLDLDIIPTGNGPIYRPASGILGRSFERKHTPQEFAEYYQFMLSTYDNKFLSCPGDQGRFSS